MYNEKYKGNVTLKKIVDEIKKSKNILLTSHVNPDGDALGSILAFYFMINEYNKKNIKDETQFINLDIVIDDKQPKYMSNFEESSLIKEYDDEILNKKFDLFISLDCANIERYGSSVKIKEKCKKSINIDHHISNTEHGDFNYIEDVCSTSELIYKFIKLFEIELTKKIAEFMYLGIINDTGNFRHDNVTPETFKLCSEIIKTGVDSYKISNIIFEISMKKANLIGEVFKNRIIDNRYNFIYYYLTYEKMKEMQIDKDDIDGISEMLLRISGVDLSLLIREEKEGIIKGSFRCNDKYNVNEMAAAFNGGGHIKAAGFRTELSYEKIVEKIYKLLEKNSQNI